MNDTDVSQFLFSTINECCEGSLQQPVSLDTPIADLRVDSLNMIQIVYEIEMQFDIEIQEHYLFQLETVADLLALVQETRAVTAV